MSVAPRQKPLFSSDRARLERLLSHLHASPNIKSVNVPQTEYLSMRILLRDDLSHPDEARNTYHALQPMQGCWLCRI